MPFFSTISVIAYLFIAVLCVIANERPIKVMTSVGDFVGTIREVSFGGENKSAQKFLGIPFAKPQIFPLYNATYYRIVDSEGGRRIVCQG